MLKKTIVSFFLVMFTLCILADDTGLEDILYSTGGNPANTNNSYKANQYKNDAEKIVLKPGINKAAPVAVQQAETKKTEMEKDLKQVYLELSKAYEENNTIKIPELELLSWKIKEQIKLVNEEINLAYQVDEFEKGLKDFPDSEEMQKLIKDVKDEAAEYIKLSKDILTLQEKQNFIKKDLDQKQSEAQIIRQKEILKNMQSAYSKKYGQ